jgi:prephenate dehydrogenase
VSQLIIVGAGLIGCSFAAGARAAGLFSEIHALEPDVSAATRACELGHVDGTVTEIPASAAVLLACPSHAVVGWLNKLADHKGPVIDVASVKGALLQQLAATGDLAPTGYVPCHPIAGRETSGPDAAAATLFLDKLVIVTPTAATHAEQLALVKSWWRALGARVEEMDADEHDRVYASTSHLPHLLAFAYLLGVDPEHLHHSGGGFRDFSRIGASDPDMWSAIFDLNSEALLLAVEDFRGHLDEFVDAIAAQDSNRLHELIAQARVRRLGLGDLT